MDFRTKIQWPTALLREAVREDLAGGDITTRAVFGNRAVSGRAEFVAKQDIILSGADFVSELIARAFPRVRARLTARDGDRLRRNRRFGVLEGSLSDILACERLCLNFLQRLSGIATLTARFAARARPHGVAIFDTRKTTPGWRAIEKAAVAHGGGINHRANLADGYLIKDNHIAKAGSAGLALRRVLSHKRRSRSRASVAIEVTTLKQLAEALPLKPDMVLLDNMKPAAIRGAVRLRGQLAPGTALEVSGGVTLKNLGRYLRLGIERISVGSLTHSAPSADISLEMCS